MGAWPAIGWIVIAPSATSSLRSTPKTRCVSFSPGLPCQPGWLPGLMAMAASRPGAFSDAKANACEAAVGTTASNTPLNGAVSVSESDGISSPLDAASDTTSVSGAAVVDWSGSMTRT